MKVCWFSTGISSFVACYLAKDVDEIIYTHVPNQHPDSLRFLVYSKGQIDGWWDELSTNLYATMTTVAGMVLREHFGFGKQRLLKFRNEFQNTTKSALDLDYLGSHYVTLEDYANELNEQFDMGIDVSRVRNCQGSYDDTDAKFRTVKLDKVLEELKAGGFEDAAQFLEKKVA